MECGAKFGLDGGAVRRSSGSPSGNGGSASPSCSSVSPASESSSSGCVESPLSSSGYSSRDAMPVAVQHVIKIITLEASSRQQRYELLNDFVIFLHVAAYTSRFSAFTFKYLTIL